MWTLRSSLEPFARCQVVSMNFGPSYIFFCQHSHAPHPDRPASVGEERDRWTQGGEGFTCCTAAFFPSLCFMTEAIWQLRYLFLLFFTRGLASTQDQTTHAKAAHRSRFLPMTPGAVCWRLVVQAYCYYQLVVLVVFCEWTVKSEGLG